MGTVPLFRKSPEKQTAAGFSVACRVTQFAKILSPEPKAKPGLSLFSGSLLLACILKLSKRFNGLTELHAEHKFT